MLRISRVWAPLRMAHVRGYADGGFEISDYLSRIEAITKATRPAGGKSGGKPGANRRPKPRQQTRQAKPIGSDATAASAGASRPANSTKPRAPRQASRQKPRQSPTPRSTVQNEARAFTQAGAQSAPQKASAASGAETEASVTQTSANAAATDGFTSLSSPPRGRAPKSGRRATAAGSRPPRRRTQAARRRGDPAAQAHRRTLQATEQDTSFLKPTEALEILLRNQNTSANGFISLEDVSIPALQRHLVPSAVTFNSRVRSLLSSLPDDVVKDREELKLLVRKHVEGSYESAIVEGSGKRVDSLDSLVHVLNANPSLDSETRQMLARVGSGKVPIKQIARTA